MQTREDAWQELNVELSNLLETFGEDDYLGGKDFWLVDDDWGEKRQKLCVNNPKILTPKLVLAVQDLLKRSAPEWELVISIDLPSCPNEGMIVASNDVRYHWDLPKLRQLLNMPNLYSN